mmetsp:Transcript_42489/g.74528  ORF Transcript_42489/g.74528 Transcript_42489/m.74528 type:complete len:206 (-) Transcript_42489:340-957(-)
MGQQKSATARACFEAEERIPKGYGGFERFHIAVKPDLPDAYQSLTCLQEGEFINCVRLSGESLKLRVPDGNEPFGSWLLPAVQASDIGCTGLVCLVDGEGMELAREVRRTLAGKNYVCRQMSGEACIQEHLTAKLNTLPRKVFAGKPEEMKRLRELLSQESNVTVETAKEVRANMFGIFSKMYCHVQVAGLVVEIAHEVEDCTGA